MLQVQKIEGRTLCSNTYVLSSKGYSFCYLVDIADYSLVRRLLPSSIDVKGVLLTHAHFDHIAGINDLLSEYPEIVIYTNKQGKEMLFSDKLNLSKYHDQSLIYKGNRIHLLNDGDVLQLFDDEELTVLHTPGHNDSCITYYNEKYIFTGDSYILGVPVVTKLPGGNKILSEDSVKRIMQLGCNREICAGHDVEKWISIF